MSIASFCIIFLAVVMIYLLICIGILIYKNEEMRNELIDSKLSHERLQNKLNSFIKKNISAQPNDMYYTGTTIPKLKIGGVR